MNRHYIPFINSIEYSHDTPNLNLLYTFTTGIHDRTPFRRHLLPLVVLVEVAVTFKIGILVSYIIKTLRLTQNK